jgi:hypothetical protein
VDAIVKIEFVTVVAGEGTVVGAGESLGWWSCPKANKPAPLTLTSTALDPASAPLKAIPFFTFLHNFAFNLLQPPTLSLFKYPFFTSSFRSGAQPHTDSTKEHRRIWGLLINVQLA